MKKTPKKLGGRALQRADRKLPRTKRVALDVDVFVIDGCCMFAVQAFHPRFPEGQYRARLFLPKGAKLRPLSKRKKA